LSVDEPVTSIWLPATSKRLDQLVTGTDYPTPRLVIVDEEPGSAPNGKRQLAAAIQLRESVPNATRVAMAIRPRNPDGNRAHLSQLTLLQHMAAEWDLDVVLDLAGYVDWLWEVEAAIFRLASRLRLVRVIHPLPRLDSQIRTRVTQRTIAACVDIAFAGHIAVVCPLPLWRWHDTQALDRSFQTAVDHLSRRFGVAALPRHLDIPQQSSTT